MTTYAKFFNHFTQQYEHEGVVERRGRWYIRVAFSGFNSPANNRDGYPTQAKAEAAVLRYQARGGY